MKSKKTNILLAVIAINLTLLSVIQLGIWPTKANANEFGLNPSINYGLVPLNADGSIDVNLSSSVEMDMNLTKIGGTQVWHNTTNTGYAILGVYAQDQNLK